MSRTYEPTDHERYLHFNKRMMDRYGISMTEKDYKDLQDRFESGDYLLMKACRGTSKSHYIQMLFNETIIYVVVKRMILRTVVTKNQVILDSSKKHHKKVKNREREEKNAKAECKKWKGNRSRKEKVKLSRAKKKMYRQDKS